MRNKVLAIGAAAVLVGGAVLFATNRPPKTSQVEQLVMLQTFDNPQFIKGVKVMASSVAQAMGKEDRSDAIGTEIRNHPQFDAMRVELVSGFSQAINGANIDDDELEQIIAFFQSDAGNKWTVATSDPSVVQGFQALFGLVQQVVAGYPDKQLTQSGSSDQIDVVTDKVVDEVVDAEVVTTVDASESQPRSVSASSGSVLSISESTFGTEVLESDLPVVVDFYADWCGPCKAMLPILDQYAEKVEGQVKVVKINVDKAASLVREYKVSGIPTFLFFKDGELKGRTSGRYALSDFEKEVNRHF